MRNNAFKWLHLEYAVKRITDCPSVKLSTHSIWYGTYFVSWLKGFNNPVAYSLKYKIGLVYYLVLKATAFLLKIQGKAMFPLKRFARR